MLNSNEIEFTVDVRLFNRVNRLFDRDVPNGMNRDRVFLLRSFDQYLLQLSVFVNQHAFVFWLPKVAIRDGGGPCSDRSIGEQF